MRIQIVSILGAALLLLGCTNAPTPGKLVDVGGFNLHIHCTGANSAAVPTVVIEAGGGVPSPVYHWIQAGLSSGARVCSYDRAGMAWSDESGQPRDADHIATQLHALLGRSGERGPYILAAHSIGALFVRVYAHRYPREVAGLVLIDPSHPGQQAVFGSTLTPEIQKRADRLARHLRFVAATGLTRLHNPVFRRSMVSSLPPEIQNQVETLSHEARSYAATDQEVRAFDTSAAQSIAAGTLGELTLLVISARTQGDQSDPASMQQLAFDEKKLALHQDLLKLSSHSRHLIVPGATHMSLVTDPRYASQVVDAIDAFIRQPHAHTSAD